MLQGDTCIPQITTPRENYTIENTGLTGENAVRDPTLRHDSACGILKKDTSEFICRSETDSQTLKNSWLSKGGGGGGEGWTGVGTAMCTPSSLGPCCRVQGTLPKTP